MSEQERPVDILRQRGKEESDLKHDLRSFAGLLMNYRVDPLSTPSNVLVAALDTIRDLDLHESERERIPTVEAVLNQLIQKRIHAYKEVSQKYSSADIRRRIWAQMRADDQIRAVMIVFYKLLKLQEDREENVVGR